MTALRNLLEAAASALDTYKSPDVSSAKEQLNTLLVAAKITDISHDWLEDLSEYGGTWHIRTGWSARGCECGDTYELPSAIVDAEDPLKAAYEHGFKREISVATTELASAEAVVVSRAERLRKAKADYHDWLWKVPGT